MNKIKVLIVDDSAFMRKAIETMLRKDPEIDVVGFARNGKEAIELVESLNPDIVTLDIEMPVMNGLEALEIIMKKFPRPVIMVSSLTTEGAEATLKALELGAVDFIPKDKSFATLTVMKIERDLIEKIKHFARKRITGIFPHRAQAVTFKREHTEVKPVQTQPVSRPVKKVPINMVLIGTSTGGPQSLQRVIPQISPDINKPILVVQHMPPNFTKSLANRLDSLSKLTVIEAQGKEKIEPNVVYIAKGGFHLKVRKIGTNYYTEVTEEPKNVLHIPNVDVMVSSAVECIGGNGLGVIMTGMGSDGKEGLKKLKQKGGIVIAQNDETCVVYGMPRAVVEAKIADEVVPLDKIAERIEYYCK
ncbi:chemotaxis response regulator protein-glutamate methylesterase [Deferribacter autotrophicus]|uniref:Protein-glutamate methylesterase/protein-glutamine glutaminase n=1 Tax=Deferribacter autotrophicus TaxID=500465 RepID=A0A5A8F0D0_9BACT|nr:chemotaxis response regulator protein-glutamate methylesterase [Deferribacter autotrophicus]KAA0257113.1 chemotaxis response regulator protein-glutamate methylesterase [Deferribacter autotrophicus]